MKNIIECKNLTHYYGEQKIFEDFSFSVERGRIVGLLGKNGVGKSTTINILMGFLEPSAGECSIFGKPIENLSPQEKSKIGLLLEGHLQYDFMTIEQIERYYAGFFPTQWKREVYYELVDKLNVPYSQTVRKLSCGQRSQVVLGLIFAQDSELLILDDYSMGLDVGYRSLFLEYLKNYVSKYNKTVLITSHIMQDLEHMVDDIIILDKKQSILQMPIDSFMQEFHQYKLSGYEDIEVKKDEIICNIESFDGYVYLYSFESKDKIAERLSSLGIHYQNIEELTMDFEKAFMGYTGRY